ncbi:MAG: ATP-binding cassette domain-containing protein [Bacteroidetes bacterium]|nr:MAG: ATP-binding cassette domain-containing protein [Bacteroidota bacterium]
MLTEIIVKNLNNRYNFNLSFQRDLNILTGRNGSGKTTLLKTIWYSLSGNIKHALNELNFDSISIVTDKEELNLSISSGEVDTIFLNFNSQLYPEKNISYNKNKNTRKSLNSILDEIPSFSEDTLFFPTFRRIEGGFFTEMKNSFYPNDLDYVNQMRLLRISRTKKFKHQFIASVSTNDIVNLLTKKYAEISTEVLKIEKEQSDFILQSVDNSNDEKGILNKIKEKQREINEQKTRLLKPFDVLSDLIQRIFKDKGIKITENLFFGDTSSAILSDKLSSGEKQMLSFLCYCIFTENSIIFIDEPELSLHPDWQRLLIPTLLEVSTTNQFFISTHSPFIYSKYPDKEIILDEDKGGI